MRLPRLNTHQRDLHHFLPLLFSPLYHSRYPDKVSMRSLSQQSMARVVMLFEDMVMMMLMMLQVMTVVVIMVGDMAMMMLQGSKVVKM